MCPERELHSGNAGSLLLITDCFLCCCSDGLGWMVLLFNYFVSVALLVFAAGFILLFCDQWKRGAGNKVCVLLRKISESLDLLFCCCSGSCPWSHQGWGSGRISMLIDFVAGEEGPFADILVYWCLMSPGPNLRKGRNLPKYRNFQKTNNPQKTQIKTSQPKQTKNHNIQQNRKTTTNYQILDSHLKFCKSL